MQNGSNGDNDPNKNSREVSDTTRDTTRASENATDTNIKPKKQWSRKGQAETVWGKVKEKYMGTQITALAKNLLTNYFQGLQISFSEFLEELARGQLIITRKKRSRISILISDELTKHNWTIQDFARETNLSDRRIQELIRSATPTEIELVWLQSVLSNANGEPYTYKELIEGLTINENGFDCTTQAMQVIERETETALPIATPSTSRTSKEKENEL